MMKKRSNKSLGRLSPEAYRNSGKMPVCFVLDNVRSSHNVGSVFRTSDAFLFTELVLCGITARPPHRDIRKTALGAELSVPWRYFDKTTLAIESIREKGWMVFAVEQVEEAILLQDLNLAKLLKTGAKGFAFIIGHEVEGVQQEVVDCCDGSVEIEQFGTKHSLNASVCAGIIAWQADQLLRNPITS